MNTIPIPRVVIGGTNSGVGKTTIVAGLLAAYRASGHEVQSFKVGPDYIDPGFHKIASGRDSYNLDTWLVPPSTMPSFFASTAEGADLAIIEGVMGLYDGGREGVSSTAEVAKQLGAPVVLVIDCKAMGESAAAIALGFREYDKDVDFRGVILNRLGSDNHERMVREGMAKIGVPVLGAIRRDDRMHSPERHLGLTPVTEVDPTKSIATIQAAVESMVDLQGLLELAISAQPLTLPLEEDIESTEKIAKIGVAYDEAFSFYYPASLHALEKAGAELVYFSPLRDKAIPDVDGLVFGGGFPEMFLEQLSQNKTMRDSIGVANKMGMPIYAECGGLMYLCEHIRDFEGKDYETVGIVPANCIMQQSLQKVGYVTATAHRETLLGDTGTVLRGHEFHFSTMEPTVKDFPWAFHLEGGRTPQSYDGGYASDNVLASYLHLNFAGSIEGAQHFVNRCASYERQR
ncbi:cobyrinate a,c-diamide synthase [Veillonella agrestimuris]|uniref:cobyrinate a,c-diamide synthase n=1 Tax=Veillonella agrestimuris TaxID=2941340 RepID=UPI00203D690F|nr:cobyrinate a,c-diamide synthase [Veillonella agrestimuris]